jgi:hypothetical protein
MLTIASILSGLPTGFPPQCLGLAGCEPLSLLVFRKWRDHYGMRYYYPLKLSGLVSPEVFEP